MYYLVALLPDRLQAETAYTALEQQDIPTDHVAILGRGFKTADEYGLIDPNESARQQALRMILWTIPFGFAAGVTFSIISALQTFSWAGEIGNHLIGGLLGAIGGAMGGSFVGGGVGLAIGGGDSLPYRNRLNAGQYLVVVRGSESLIRQASRILKPLRPNSLKDYFVPES